MNNAVLRRNNVKVLGKGAQTIVFVHGFGCDQTMWRFVTDAFKDDYQLVLLDLTGAGQSQLEAYDENRYSELGGHARDIIEVCDALQLDSIILVGHSVSAMIGGLVDIIRPGLMSRLVMIGPSPRYINDPDNDYFGGFTKKDIEDLLDMMANNYLAWSANLGPAIMGNKDRPELGKELTDSFCQTNEEIARHFARVTFLSDNRSDLTKIKVRTLVLQMQQDIIAPNEVGHYVHHALPNSKLIEMEATGHCPHVSAPKETITSIKAFIK